MSILTLIHHNTDEARIQSSKFPLYSKSCIIEPSVMQLLHGTFSTHIIATGILTIHQNWYSKI